MITLAITELQKYNNIISPYTFIKRSYILELMVASNAVDRYKIILDAISSNTGKWHKAAMTF